MPAASKNLAAKHAIGRAATIRSVPSFESSESSPEVKQNGFSPSNSNTSGLSASLTIDNDPKTSHPPKIPSESTGRWNTGGVRVIEPPSEKDSPIISEGTDPESGQWDSTIGKAGLGKTGRVINKLVSDNDALKREIQIERLRAEEAKQAAKLVEDKMDRMINEYEGRLLEANVTKTLLARKERQVETLTTTVDTEKKKAMAAIDSEKTWRDEMEKMRTDTKQQVEKANTHAQLMEGRYNAISSHWREQGDQVKRAVTRMRGEISTIVQERKDDDDKIQTLRDLCEQQDSNIKELRREKEEIARLFAEYKKTQDDDLHNIKSNARRRETEQEKMLEEARDALHKLKWALNVKKNVKGAE
ncbi:mother-specific HO expression [Lecanicillium sp. MT-2017a]|nr:mother-specific HO expression [Lecanicillium sp. MT-2017a]